MQKLNEHFISTLLLLELRPTLTRLSLSGGLFYCCGAAGNSMEGKLPLLKLQEVKLHGVPIALTARQLLELVRRCPELQRLEVKAGLAGGPLSRQLTDGWLQAGFRIRIRIRMDPH